MNHSLGVLLHVAIALMAVLHAYPTGEQETAQPVETKEEVGQPLVVASAPQDETLGTAESAWGWGGYGRGWGGGWGGGYGRGWGGGYGRGWGGYGGYGRGWGGYGGWGRGWGYYG